MRIEGLVWHHLAAGGHRDCDLSAVADHRVDEPHPVEDGTEAELLSWHTRGTQASWHWIRGSKCPWLSLVLNGHEAAMALDLDPPLELLLRAEAGEFELLEREEHPGEAVDHLRVAAGIYLEHLRVQADGSRETLGLLEALVRIIPRRRERERGNGHVVGQASPPSVAVREGSFPPRMAPMRGQKTYRSSAGDTRTPRSPAVLAAEE